MKIEAVAHEGDSTVFMRLATSAMDVNELCQSFKSDISRIGLFVAQAMIDIEQNFEARRITKDQRDRLMVILKNNLEPTADNGLPIYSLRFPSPDYVPPRIA